MVYWNWQLLTWWRWQHPLNNFLTGQNLAWKHPQSTHSLYNMSGPTPVPLELGAVKAWRQHSTNKHCHITHPTHTPHTHDKHAHDTHAHTDTLWASQSLIEFDCHDSWLNIVRHVCQMSTSTFAKRQADSKPNQIRGTKQKANHWNWNWNFKIMNLWIVNTLSNQPVISSHHHGKELKLTNHSLLTGSAPLNLSRQICCRMRRKATSSRTLARPHLSC